MNLFYVLLVLLVLTRVMGELAERLRQPALVGELVAGIALGLVVASYPGAFPNLTDIAHNDVFVSITNLGMFFLMLYAGLEMQPHKIFEHSISAISVAVGGMVLPLAIGLGIGLLFLPESEMRAAQALFIGTALAITAVPATVRILMDFNFLNTRAGQTIVSAAVFDDVLSLLLLAWLTGMVGASEMPGIADIFLLAGKIAVFFVVTAVIGLFIFPWGGRLMHHLKAQELEISAMLVGGFAFAVFAELLGLHFILGAFVAGLYFGQKTIDLDSYERVRRTTSALTFGFLAPIFFASIGLNLDVAAIVEAPWFLLIIILAAFLGKVAGAGGAALTIGFQKLEAGIIGIGMSPRGAVELVIAGIALEAGLFEQPKTTIVANLFSAVVIMSVVTTVLSPILLRYTFIGVRPRQLS